MRIAKIVGLFAAVLATAWDIGPTTLLPDLPTQFAGFHPENNDNRYRGAVPAREALAQSLNVPAVRLLKLYGASKFYAFLKKMGFTTLFRPADQYGLSLILGFWKDHADEMKSTEEDL
jgi:penicillin-binding protein 1C